MAKKRSRNPQLLAFGLYLEELRGRRTRGQIEQRLKALGTPLTESTLHQYERGTVWAPDPGVLRSLAKTYNVPSDYLLQLLIANRATPHLQTAADLIRHVGALQQGSSLQGGDAHGDAAARVLKLEEAVTFYKSLAEKYQAVVLQVRPAIEDILDALAGEGDPPATGTPAHRPPSRKRNR